MGFGFNVIALYPWFVTGYDLFEQIWSVVEHHQHLLSEDHAIFSAALFLPKTSIKIAWHEPNGMPTSSVTSLIVIWRLSKIIFFTVSMFSSVVNVLGQPGRTSSLISQPFLKRLYYNWTCVLLIVDSPNATVNISNILTHLISFFTHTYIICHCNSSVRITA